VTKYNADARGTIYLAVASFDDFGIKASNNEILDAASFTDFIVYTSIYDNIFMQAVFICGCMIIATRAQF